jgi:hypothetical protein
MGLDTNKYGASSASVSRNGRLLTKRQERRAPRSMPTSTFIARSSMVSSVRKGKGCNFTKLGCSVLRTSPPCNARRVPVCYASSRGAGSSPTRGRAMTRRVKAEILQVFRIGVQVHYP